MPEARPAVTGCRRQGPPTDRRQHPDRDRTLLAFALLALLGACHTTAGMGEDISRTGKTIERSAVRAAP